MDETTRKKDPLDLTHHCVGILYVFQHGVTFDPLKCAVGKGQSRGIGDDVHAGEAKQIEVYVPVYKAPATPDVQVSAAKRGNDTLR